MRYLKPLLTLIGAAFALIFGLLAAAAIAVTGAVILVASRLLGRKSHARVTWHRGGVSGATGHAGSRPPRPTDPDAIDVAATEVRTNPTLQ